MELSITNTPIPELNSRKPKLVILTKEESLKRKEDKTYMDITKIPDEILILILQENNYIILQNICRLSCVSKSYNKLFSKESIWFLVFLEYRAFTMYNKKLNTLSKYFMGKTSFKDKKIKLIIKNNSDINFDLYIVKIIDTPRQYRNTPSSTNEFIDYIKINKTPIFPGEYLVKNTFDKTRMIAIPTMNEFIDKKLANVGFSFIINGDKLELFKHQDNTTTRGYLRIIKEPTKRLSFSMKKPSEKTYKQTVVAKYFEHYNKEVELDISYIVSPINTPFLARFWDYKNKVYVTSEITLKDLNKKYKLIKLSKKNSGIINLDDIIEDEINKKKEIDLERKILRNKLRILEKSSKEYGMSIDRFKYVKNCL
tara:strand:- start:725 stop:1828 length:1104 start_codon:yes stop_codon:yes gene_type:complete